MDNQSRNSSMISTVVMGALIAAVLLVIFYFGGQIGPGIEQEMGRTVSTPATLTITAQSDQYYIFNLSFRYNDNIYKKDVSCLILECEVEYTSALKTGKVTVWLNPKNPENAYVRKPLVWAGYIPISLYWGTIILLVGAYIVFLYNIWIKKSA